MRKQNALPLAAMLLVSVLAMIGRQASAIVPPQNDKDETAQQKPDKDKDKDKLAKAVDVAIAPVRYDGEAKQVFKVGQPVWIGVWMTNTTNEPLTVAKGDEYFYTRPKLTKDGQPVRYRSGVPKRIKSADENGPSGVRVIAITLPPNQRTGADILDLRTWYDPLEPGRYELTLRYRFEHKGAAKLANTVSFEVAP